MSTIVISTVDVSTFLGGTTIPVGRGMAGRSVSYLL